MPLKKNPQSRAAPFAPPTPELFAILNALRRKIAQQHDLPPYVIFQDPSLDAMATTYPVTIEELPISRCGRRQGHPLRQDFVKVIKAYVDENEIERPKTCAYAPLRTRANSKFRLFRL